MIPQETIKQLENTPVEDRLHLVEILLDSLKRDITSRDDPHRLRKNVLEAQIRDFFEAKKLPTQKKAKFTVRTFNLGMDVQPDRDLIYSERGF